MNIQTVTSPGGIEAWLVEDHADPMLALRFAFDGGSSQVPAAKEGLANFTTIALGCSAGDFTAMEFRERIEDLAIHLHFNPRRDVVVGLLESLTESRDEAAELLKLALTQPRFDADTVERTRQRLFAFLASSERNPYHVASGQWNAVAFPGHAYSHRVAGNSASIAQISAADLSGYCSRLFAKDGLKVVAVGDVTAEQLGALVDNVFGNLPAHGDYVSVAKVGVALGAGETVIDMDVARAVMVFGMEATPRKDPDFMSAYVLNQIVGGDGSSSRLMQEICYKRGLAHSVKTEIKAGRYASCLKGSVATRGDTAGRLLDIVREELEKMAGGDISQAELDNAKHYLIGSYPLKFNANTKIAEQLLELWIDGFGADYFYSRNAMVKAITLDNLKRVAKRLLKPENLVVTIAGRPNLHQVRTSNVGRAVGAGREP